MIETELASADDMKRYFENLPPIWQVRWVETLYCRSLPCPVLPAASSRQVIEVIEVQFCFIWPRHHSYSIVSLSAAAAAAHNISLNTLNSCRRASWNATSAASSCR